MPSQAPKVLIDTGVGTMVDHAVDLDVWQICQAKVHPYERGDAVAFCCKVLCLHAKAAWAVTNHVSAER